MALLWLIDNTPEIIATITGLLYILYSIERRIVCWPYGIVSSAIYVYVFYGSGIFADMALYVYYVFIGFYGWYNWQRSVRTDTGGSLQVKRAGPAYWLWLLLVTSIFFIVISHILKNYSPSTIPYWDAFTTAVSITATWMLTRKVMEHWILWIIVDTVSMGIYFYKGLYPTIILFLVYTVLAVKGYIDWYRTWQKQWAATNSSE